MGNWYDPTPDTLRRLDCDIILGTIARNPIGRQLTPEAQQRAAEFAAANMGKGLNWGQLADVGIKHVTDGILKD